MQPKLWNLYGRITLVNRSFPERVTLDLDLRFSADGGWSPASAEGARLPVTRAGASVALPGVVTAEVKQAGRPRPTVFIQVMHQLQVRAGGFSKYCVGVSLLYPHLKHNNFRPQLRALAHLADGSHHVVH